MSNRSRADYTIPLTDGLDLYDKAATNALERLAKLGLDIVDIEDRPKDGRDYFDGRLPANVHSLNLQELSKIYGLMIRHADWVSGCAVIAKAEKGNCAEKLKLAKARIRKTKTGNNSEKDDDTVCDSRYVEVSAMYQEASDYHSFLENIETSARRDCAFLSRLIEPKKIEFEQGRREGNVGRKRDRFQK